VFSYLGSLTGVSRIQNTPAVFSLTVKCKLEAETIIVPRSRYGTKKLRVTLKNIMMDDFREEVGYISPTDWRDQMTSGNIDIPEISRAILESPFEVDIVNGEVHKVIMSSIETKETTMFKKVLLSALIIKLPPDTVNRLHGISMPDSWTVPEHGVDGLCENSYIVSEIAQESLPEDDIKLMKLELCEDKKIFEVIRTRDVTKCQGRNLFMSQGRYEECHAGGCSGPQSQIVTKYLGCGVSKDSIDLHGIVDFAEHPETEEGETNIQTTLQFFTLDKVENIADVLPLIKDPQSTENVVYEHPKNTTQLQRDSPITTLFNFQESIQTEHSFDTILAIFKKYLMVNMDPSQRPVVEEFSRKLKRVNAKLREQIARLIIMAMNHSGCINGDVWQFKHDFGLGHACGIPDLVNQIDPEYLLSTVIQLLSIDTYEGKICEGQNYTVSSEPTCDQYQFVQKENLPLMNREIARDIIHAPQISNWRTDGAFINHFLNGMNPMMIKKVNSLEELHIMLQTLHTWTGHREETMANLIEQERLFMADYSILDITPPIHHNKALYSPQVLMRLKSGKLHMVAILLTSQKSGVTTELITPISSPNRWLFAKMHVALADIQAHQFVHHLPLHFMMETVAMANHNWLKDHAVGKLLEPHFKGTILINFIARNTLLSHSGQVQKLFPIELGGGLKLTVIRFNFTNLDFPKQMLERGFPRDKTDGVSGFYYRDDSYALWDILLQFVNSVVNHIYTSDLAVIRDTQLQRWAKGIADTHEGNFPDFPDKIWNKDHLVKILTSLIFSASVQHQALGAPQYLGSFMPSRPISLNEWMPEEEVVPESILVKSLPSLEKAKQTFHTANLLSKQSLCTIVMGTGSFLEEYLGSQDTEYKFIRNQLVRDLEALSDDIRSRAPNPYSYQFLDPRKVACSIDI